MKTIITLFIAVILCSRVFSQVSQQWYNTYNGTGNQNDFLAAMTVDNSGNVYAAGNSRGVSSNDDIAIVKYNSAGVVQWSQRFNGSANNYDFAKSICVDNSGNVYVAGSTTGTGTNLDYTIVKYNSAGVEQWVRWFISSGVDYLRKMIIDASGNVYVTGLSNGDIKTIKFDANGNMQWAQAYNGPGNDLDDGFDIAIDPSGNVIVGGITFGPNNYDFAIVKYNSNGVFQWAQTYNGPGNGADYCRDIFVDVSGNIYAAGEGPGTGTGEDIIVLKISSSGSVNWVNRFNGSANGPDYGNSVSADASGNSFVTGSLRNSGGNDDFVTIKYNSFGTQQWANIYNGPVNSNDVGASLVLDNSGNVYVTGSSAGTSSWDIYTIKYSTSGVSLWEQRYNGAGNNLEQGKVICTDPAGNIYIGGLSYVDNYDYFVLKYSQPTGINQITGEIPVSLSLEQNYPNPFNPETHIRFSVPVSGNAKLTVLDMLGREVITLVNENLNAGTYNVDWNASGYPSGVYFYRIKTEGYDEVKKMILVK